MKFAFVIVAPLLGFISVQLKPTLPEGRTTVLPTRPVLVAKAEAGPNPILQVALQLEAAAQILSQSPRQPAAASSPADPESVAGSESLTTNGIPLAGSTVTGTAASGGSVLGTQYAGNFFGRGGFGGFGGSRYSGGGGFSAGGGGFVRSGGYSGGCSGGSCGGYSSYSGGGRRGLFHRRR